MTHQITNVIQGVYELKMGCSFLPISSMALSTLIHSAGCSSFFKFRKMSFLSIHRAQDVYLCPPPMPTPSIECKILAWIGKHVLVSEAASF